MKISIEWFGGTYPQFNVSLSAVEGRQEFMSIKGVRIREGKDGEFVSWPATKSEKTGKYWNHVWGSDAFNQAVLEAAKASQPGASDQRRDEAPAPRRSSSEPPPRRRSEQADPNRYTDDDIPF